jgi:hypothetical protein
VSDDRYDTILDACLDELLGGHRPPDLRDRILRVLAERERGARAPGVDVPPAAVTTPPPASPVAQKSLLWRYAGRLAVALTLVVAAGTTTVMWWLRSPESPQRIPQPVTEARPVPAPAPSSSVAVDEPVPEIRLFDPAPSPEVADPALPAPDPLPARLSDREIVALINERLRAEWRLSGLEPAPAEDDRGWCERVFRRLTGRAPTEEEVGSFLARDPARRRPDLVMQIFTEARYQREFASYFAERWTSVLLGTASDPGRIHREAFRQQLATAFQRGQSLAEMTTELLTATGTGREPEDAAAGFLLAHFDPQGRAATAHTSSVFLGRQFRCAECHDHPADSTLTQRKYWELNAFFRQLALRREGPQQTLRLADVDFLGENQGDGKDAPVFFETPDGVLKAAYPTLTGAAEPPRSGRLEDLNRRALLAAEIVRSDSFRQAMVNRIWAFVFGYGFTFPVDDVGPHRLPSHPQLLDQLAEQLAAHGFQLPTLTGWLVLSDAFGLAAGSATPSRDAPERGAPPLFSRAYEPPFARTPAVESLARLGASPEPSAVPAAPARRTPDVGARGNPGREPVVALPPVLSPPPPVSLDRSTHVGPDPLIIRILGSGMTVVQKVSHLFLAMLEREPTADERRAATRMLERQADPRRALEDIWWALWQSQEFANR